MIKKIVGLYKKIKFTEFKKNCKNFFHLKIKNIISNKRYTIIAITIIMLILFLIINNIIFISFPLFPNIKINNNEYRNSLTTKQKDIYIEHYKVMVDYYNGIVTGKYSPEEYSLDYYISYSKIEDIKSSISSLEKNNFLLACMDIDSMALFIDLARLDYDYGKCTKIELIRSIKKTIKNSLKENIK